MLVFVEGGNPGEETGVPGEKPSEQGRGRASAHRCPTPALQVPVVKEGKSKKLCSFFRVRKVMQYIVATGKNLLILLHILVIFLVVCIRI